MKPALSLGCRCCCRHSNSARDLEYRSKKQKKKKQTNRQILKIFNSCLSCLACHMSLLYHLQSGKELAYYLAKFVLKISGNKTREIKLRYVAENQLLMVIKMWYKIIITINNNNNN